MDPIVSPQVMVRIKTVGTIVVSNAVLDDIPGSFHTVGLYLQSIPTCFEAVPIASFLRRGIRLVPIIERPAVIDGNRSQVTNQVETIVTIIPGTASMKDISFVSCLCMAAESVSISSCTLLAHAVVIVISIAIEEKVVASSPYTESNAHAIMNGDILYDVIGIAPPYGHAFRLGMGGDGDLRPNDIKILEMQIVRMDIENGYPLADWLYLG